ncbi:hypothetical protein T01_14578 [Trichinella spiralis]|uniref:Uncharacterized protein n=1 Tax=Trichinella spiralis TaxID=6334 RepID=A0A0V1BK20_TRISP|nr:hypothetical protein T01_14578 [Trichinella spiralis]
MSNFHKYQTLLNETTHDCRYSSFIRCYFIFQFNELKKDHLSRTQPFHCGNIYIQQNLIKNQKRK